MSNFKVFSRLPFAFFLNVHILENTRKETSLSVHSNSQIDKDIFDDRTLFSVPSAEGILTRLKRFHEDEKKF